MEPGSCAYLSKQGSPEEQLPKHLPTSISCKDLQNKGTKIPCSTSAGTPQDPPPSLQPQALHSSPKKGSSKAQLARSILGA